MIFFVLITWGMLVVVFARIFNHDGWRTDFDIDKHTAAKMAVFAASLVTLAFMYSLLMALINTK